MDMESRVSGLSNNMLFYWNSIEHFCHVIDTFLLQSFRSTHSKTPTAPPPRASLKTHLMGDNDGFIVSGGGTMAGDTTRKGIEATPAALTVYKLSKQHVDKNWSSIKYAYRILGQPMRVP